MTEFDSVILPGGEGKVTASMNTDHLKGPVAKSVTVSSEDPTVFPVTLTLKANVRVPVDVTPSDRVQLQGKLGEVAPAEVTVAALDGKPFDVTGVTTTAPGVDVKVLQPAGTQAKAGTLASGSATYKVRVSPAKDAGVGQSFITASLKTTHPKAENVSITVTLGLKGDVEVTPSRLLFFPAPTATPGQDPMTQHVRLTKAEGATLAVLGVETGDPDFKTTLATVREGREFDVEVRYTGAAGRGFIKSELKVKTNDPKQKEIVIPITGRS